MRRFALLVVGLVLGVVSARADELPVVAVVKSGELAPYDKAVTAFALEARARLVEYDLKGDRARATLAFEALKSHPPALVWALGPLAAVDAHEDLPDVPLVFALVPNDEKYGLSGPNVTGVSLTRAPRAQLETLRALAPATRAVGVVYDPRSSALLVARAQRAATALGLKLVPAAVSDASQVGETVASLAGKIDALWMVADRTVSTVSAFETLLAFSRAHAVPVFALSEEEVRAGALVSLAPDLAAIGRQSARLVNRILRGGIAPGALPVEEPEALDLAINLSAAQSFGKGCTLALDIFTFAARHHYPIDVFQ